MLFPDAAQIEQCLIAVYNVVWGWPLVTAIMAIGLYFTCHLKTLRPSLLKMSLKSIFDKDEYAGGDVSVFASLCTALSATIGTGNVVGMAVAVTLGGPGALFWLWVSSALGLAIKYAEGLLAIKYRKVGADGKITGGPMCYIELGLADKKYSKWLAKTFALAGTITALISTGTLAQSNSIATAMKSFGIPLSLAVIITTACATIVICGGLKRIATVSERLVPVMTIFYVGAATVILLLNFREIPTVLGMIFNEAFMPGSIAGGGIGYIISVASIGVGRGIYSHEAGLGSSAIAAATSKTGSPCRQGLASMSGVIFSVIMCTVTGLVLIITRNETSLFTDGQVLQGLQLTSFAFGCGLGAPEFGKYIVDIGIILFAFTTIIGWNYYGEKCVQYVFGDKSIVVYKLFYIFFVAIGPFLEVKTIFIITDILMGFMAISNLVGLWKLRKIVIDESREILT